MYSFSDPLSLTGVYMCTFELSVFNKYAANMFWKIWSNDCKYNFSFSHTEYSIRSTVIFHSHKYEDVIFTINHQQTFKDPSGQISRFTYWGDVHMQYNNWAHSLTENGGEDGGGKWVKLGPLLIQAKLPGVDWYIVHGFHRWSYQWTDGDFQSCTLTFGVIETSKKNSPLQPIIVINILMIRPSQDMQLQEYHNFPQLGLDGLDSNPFGNKTYF